MGKAVLFVDDSLSVLKILQIQFEEKFINNNFHSEYISNPLDTIPIIEELSSFGIETVLIVVDFEMPKLNGASLIKIVNKIFPKIKFIMLSGQASQALVQELLESKYLEAYYSKPWEMKELMDEISELTKS